MGGLSFTLSIGDMECAREFSVVTFAGALSLLFFGKGCPKSSTITPRPGRLGILPLATFCYSGGFVVVVADQLAAGGDARAR